MQRMKRTTDSSTTTKQSTLQRVLTTAINDLGVDTTVAIINQEHGPLIPQVSRGFTDREVRAIFRALSGSDWIKGDGKGTPDGSDPKGGVQLRMVTPGTKNLLAVPLRDEAQIYGALVLGKKEGTAFTKRDKASIESASTNITGELQRARLFDSTVILGRPPVVQEPLPSLVQEDSSSMQRCATPEIQEGITGILTVVGETLPFDRAWVTLYDPLAALLEVLGSVGGHKKELLPGQRLPMDESASGWAVRHRKPRTDQNLASTQGRFQDYKQLYRERFRSTLIVPFFVRGRVAGTVTLASKTPMQYESAEVDAKKIEAGTTKLSQLFEDPSAKLTLFSSPDLSQKSLSESTVESPPKPEIRRDERQAALREVSSFLATEICEPMGYIRAQLEEVTGEGSLAFESQTRVEAAIRDLIRIETLLREILDFAKPLELDRRLCQVPDLLNHALALIATDLKVSRIEVIKDYPARMGQVLWDEAKMQQAFHNIFKNALEAMSPGGHLRVTATLKRGRQPQVHILIHNDGVPIPEEHVDKVFEPYFTTKRSGTGLGLATVKKVVEEHQGRISIESGPEKGTTLTLRLPALRPRVPYRGRGGPRRPRRMPKT